MGIPLGASEVNKLNELAAKAMGWYESIETVGDMLIRWYGNDAQTFTQRVTDWNPSTDLNDAAEFLEKITNGNPWYLVKHDKENLYLKETRLFWYCYADGEKKQAHSGYAETEALAKCLCALRAANISEQEIQDALK